MGPDQKEIEQNINSLFHESDVSAPKYTPLWWKNKDYVMQVNSASSHEMFGWCLLTPKIILSKGAQASCRHPKTFSHFFDTNEPY